MPPLPPLPAGTPPLVWLAQHPEVLDTLIAAHNALRGLEVVVVSAGVTKRAAIQFSGQTAVVKIDL
jgi:hypothetical protein